MRKRVVVIGAGIGGLSAALDLAASGLNVTLLEAADAPGGKMRELQVGGVFVDSGPTVFTMRWVFEELFADAGLSLEDSVDLHAAEELARHSWLDGGRLDLFADLDRSVEAIGDFAGAADARAYREFASRSQRVFETLDHTFMRAEKPSPTQLAMRVGLGKVGRLLETRPFTTLWSELGNVFSDPRLRQLFGRYSTYCGSSPLESPATLMLIAHAERAGVWMVRGGMQRFAEALVTAAKSAGADCRFGARVERILEDGKVTGVELADGETINADAVVFNGDINALSHGILGDTIRRRVKDRRTETRSLSALTWSMRAKSSGFPLRYHSVFFGGDYSAEFEAIFKHQSVCDEPTVYICAQDRIDSVPPDSEERLFLLMNAPPRVLSDDEVSDFEQRSFAVLERHGLGLDAQDIVRTTPQDYAARFPGSEGAIYGWPTHGAFGSFTRSGSISGLPGLYFAGGTVHPGPGVPMTALSGRIAARQIREDMGIS